MSFHVNREKRNWMVVDFFLFFKMRDTRCMCIPMAMTQ